MNALQIYQTLLSNGADPSLAWERTLTAIGGRVVNGVAYDVTGMMIEPPPEALRRSIAGVGEPAPHPTLLGRVAPAIPDVTPTVTSIAELQTVAVGTKPAVVPSSSTDPGIASLSWQRNPTNTDVLSTASKVLSSVLGKDPNRTVSAQAYEAAAQGDPGAAVVNDVLNWLDPGHGAEAYAADPASVLSLASRCCCTARYTRYKG